MLVAGRGAAGDPEGVCLSQAGRGNSGGRSLTFQRSRKCRFLCEISMFEKPDSNENT